MGTTSVPGRIAKPVTAVSCSSAAICRLTESVKASKAASPNVSETQVPIPSLADRTRAVNAEAAIVGVHFLGAAPVFVLGEEALLFAGETERRVAVHSGAIMASAADGERIITGGDDGNLVETGADGAHRVVAADDKKRWIDQVALGPDGALAWSAGKTAHVRTKKGDLRSFEAPSTVAGLCFAPKGFRVAIAHYN